MGVDNHIVELIEAQRRENREQFKELRSATTSMAESVSRLTTTFARMEERHISHDDGMKRLGKVVDDHAERIRIMELSVGKSEGYDDRIKTLETSRSTAIGGWKVITVVASVAATLATLAISFMGTVPS